MGAGVHDRRRRMRSEAALYGRQGFTEDFRQADGLRYYPARSQLCGTGGGKNVWVYRKPPTGVARSPLAYQTHRIPERFVLWVFERSRTLLQFGDAGGGRFLDKFTERLQASVFLERDPMEFRYERQLERGRWNGFG